MTIEGRVLGAWWWGLEATFRGGASPRAGNCWKDPFAYDSVVNCSWSVKSNWWISLTKKFLISCRCWHCNVGFSFQPIHMNHRWCRTYTAVLLKSDSRRSPRNPERGPTKIAQWIRNINLEIPMYERCLWCLVNKLWVWEDGFLNHWWWLADRFGSWQDGRWRIIEEESSYPLKDTFWRQSLLTELTQIMFFCEYVGNVVNIVDAADCLCWNCAWMRWIMFFYRKIIAFRPRAWPNLVVWISTIP